MTEHEVRPAVDVAAPQRPDYMGKRGFDLFVAAVGLVVTAPIWPLIAIAIRLESPGPTLHRATRVGRGGRPFVLLKFRSMRLGAGGPGVTAGSDARITRSGRLLRKSKLDELPQLINVLRNDMSLVGPRPEDPRYVAWYTPAQRAVLGVRPGITGAAAVAYRHEEAILAKAADVEEAYRHDVLPAKLELELDYLDGRRFASDLRILAQTVAAVFRRAT